MSDPADGWFLNFLSSAVTWVLAAAGAVGGGFKYLIGRMDRQDENVTAVEEHLFREMREQTDKLSDQLAVLTRESTAALTELRVATAGRPTRDDLRELRHEMRAEIQIIAAKLDAVAKRN